MEHSAAEGQVKLTSNSYWADDEPRDCTPQSVEFMISMMSLDTLAKGYLEDQERRKSGKTHPDSELDPTKLFLLYLIREFRTCGGMIGLISERIKSVAAAYGDTCEFTLDSIEKKILQGEVNNFDSFMANIRSLHAIYILGRPKNSALLPELMEFQKFLMEAKEPRHSPSVNQQH